MRVQARLIAGMLFEELAIEGAVDALLAGVDDLAVAELAGLSRSSGIHEVRACLDRALESLGIPTPMPLTDARIIVLREMAAEVLAGRLDAREMSRWAHRVIGHEGIEVAHSIVLLDDELDYAELGGEAPDVASVLTAFLRDSAEWDEWGLTR